METRYTWSELVVLLMRGERYARKHVRLVEITREVSPHYVFGEDVLTIQMNPVFVGYDLVPKTSAPMWLKKEIGGRRQYASDEPDTIHRKKKCELAAYSMVATIVLRKKGYDGYIQGELPF